MTQKRIYKAFIATSLDGFISRLGGVMEWLTNPPLNDQHAAPTGSQSATSEYESTWHLSTTLSWEERYLKLLHPFRNGPNYPNHRVLVLSRAGRNSNSRHQHVTFVRSIEAALAEMDAGDAKGVYVDGGNVIQQFLTRGLIDEITITLAPVLLGRGISLFGDIGSGIKLTLLASFIIEHGMVMSQYKANNL